MGVNGLNASMKTDRQEEDGEGVNDQGEGGGKLVEFCFELMEMVKLVDLSTGWSIKEEVGV